MTLILSLLLINVQWFKITYQIQHTLLSLETLLVQTSFLLPLSALNSGQAGLLAHVQAHFAIFCSSPLLMICPPLFLSPIPKAFLLNPIQVHSFIHSVLLANLYQVHAKCWAQPLKKASPDFPSWKQPAPLSLIFWCFLPL